VWRRPALFFVTLVINACSPTVPSSTSYCPLNGSLVAQIDGVAWSADCVAATNSVVPRYIEIKGNTQDGAQWLTFRVYAAQPGTYQLGGPEPPVVGVVSSAGLNLECQHHPGTCPAWGTGTGTITISNLTGASASGTFSFDLIANTLTGATGAKAVTNGRFNVTF